MLRTALQAQAFRFVRQTALAWLAAYDGDAEVYLLRARALIGEGRARQALSILEQICQADPEYIEAQKLRADLIINIRGKDVNTYQDQVYALGESPSAQSTKTAQWSQALRSARNALAKGEFELACDQAQVALASGPESCLLALTHIQALRNHSDTPKAAIRSLAKHYQELWPESIAIMLIRAESLMDGGQSDQAVALLHRAASLDIAGQVASRLWGSDHPYRALWPKNPSARLDIAIPAKVAAVLGWNLLPKGEVTSASNEIDLSHTPSEQAKPEKLRIVQDELDRIAKRLKKTSLARSDGRLPIYVIFSTREGLQRKYGPETTTVLDQAMRQLALALRTDPHWGSILIYADDPANMAEFNLKPAQSKDAWGLKLALSDLDTSLRKRGAMIGALLIVGGPDVVPFHHLPNPTDDHDADVPSDNPYATRTENYFVPEWPVGRLPGGAGQDPGMLLSALRSITLRYEQSSNYKKNWLQRLWEKISLRFTTKKRTQRSFGYSAEIWKQAAIDVFRPIGEMRDIDISPPIISETFKLNTGAQLGYYNLHGIEDGPFWYGHKAPNSGNDGPDYPIALRPEDIPMPSKPFVNASKNGTAQVPHVIFSEACYGANIMQRSIEEAMALKFLLAGSQAVIGSTVTSYGSISTPLIAADMLGQDFWQFLQEGFPVGESLRRAKIHLAQEMHTRQGYLDGEDQKTLISFVLYGDPLAQPVAMHKLPKAVMRTVRPLPQVKIICDRPDTPGTSEPISTDVIAHIKNIVSQYLPGMQGAQLVLSHEHNDCDCKGHNCPTGQLGKKTRPEHDPLRSVVTLSKSIEQAQHTHQRYARLTLDKQGKIVKIAVSR
jgi:tetratricopeptide (TPR) repeat protein